MQLLRLAAVVRALGPDVAEVPVLAVRPDLQGNALGRCLLALLEANLLAAGVRMVTMPGGAEPDLGGATIGNGMEAPESQPEAAATGSPQVRRTSFVLLRRALVARIACIIHHEGSGQTATPLLIAV